MKKVNLDRVKFGQMKDIAEVPHFLEYQKNSFENFLQFYKKPGSRENIGLEKILREFFPISSTYGNVKLEYVEYKLENSEFPSNNLDECRKRSKTYTVSLKAKLRLVNNEQTVIQESWVYMCDIPLMTEEGTFLVNGTERVVVSQLHRSPGVFFSEETNSQSGKDIYNAKIMPYRGMWIEIETTKDNTLHVKIDKKKKVSFSVFVKALGFFKNNADIAKTFFKKSKNKITDWESLRDTIIGTFLAQDVIDSETGEVVLEVGSYVTKENFDILSQQKIEALEVYAPASDQEVLVNTLINDQTKDRSSSSMELFKKLRSSDIPTEEGSKNFIKSMFFDPDRYNLSDIGRYKINTKLNLEIKENEVCLTKEDIVAITEYILKLQNNNAKLDDINSLSHRRVRGVGELLSVQVRLGLNRIERHAKERMSMNDPYTVSLQSLLNTKFLFSVIMDFFATGQLSQFMDQTNPLSSLTHKRKISSLGQGGVSRERATFDVRDVHGSHYGRLCPVETPEGPNIGLIVSLASFARINKYGFIETPYARVEDGKIQFDKIDYLSYDDETRCLIAQVDTPRDENGNILTDRVLCRDASEDRITMVNKDRIKYIDVSPRQVVSVSASLIPFLEHTDANRALTGSNMQRQAVPLIKTERPYIATGIESKVARDACVLIISDVDGVVSKVDASTIEILDKNKKTRKYHLMNFVKSNHSMSMMQKPLVNVGDVIKVGDIIADGPSTCDGELSIGKNVTVAFMPWEGYNFEDAILISERLVKEDVFTSIHIEEYDLEERNTKLGDEQITREIPNVSEDAVKDLGGDGIVRIGAEVTSGSILVGKITPKTDADPGAEERLLRAIFGEKAKDFKDNSLRLPHGSKGVVVGVLELNRNKGDDLPAGVNKIVKIYVAEKRKITVGDKMCGRHGNKGIVSRILPVEDMPFLPNGKPIDVVLNPLGVPSRMNIGQVFETHLGWAAAQLGIYMATPVFDGAKESEIKSYLKKAGCAEDGKSILYDGRTGRQFDHRITVGCMYMLKLHHLVEDKMHARSIGPYSLVTQQPLGGKAQMGGQRLGEMEVWCLESYGAANILREMLTIKSDDIFGRTQAYEAIVKGADMPEPGEPESFKVLVKEFYSLGLNVSVYDKSDNFVNIDGQKIKDKPDKSAVSYLEHDEENS